MAGGSIRREMGWPWEEGLERKSKLILASYALDALAVSRTLIALLENFQREDGSVRIPAKLAAYTGFQEIAPKAAGG
jgi:seryl-tRNA synthetase